MPVVLVRGREVTHIGTAFSVTSDGLLLTAGHVIDKLGATHEDDPDGWVGVIWLDHLFEGDGRAGIPSLGIPLELLSQCLDHDVGIMRARPTLKDDGSLVSYVSLKLDFGPPEIGNQILGLGYRHVVVDLDEPLGRERVDDVGANLYAAGGRIMQFEPKGMGEWKPFPLGITDAKFDHGMSGGPVINGRTGRVCGLVHGGIPSPAYERKRTSFFAPSASALNVPVARETEDGRFVTLYDLIKRGTVEGGTWF